MTGEPQVVTPPGDLLGEGPVWDEATATLHWVDILGRAVHRWSSATGERTTWSLPEMPGAVVLAGDGRLVVAAERGFGMVDPIDGSFELIAECPGPQRMNDGKCDPAGRFWAGTCPLSRNDPPGALFVLHADHSVTVAVTDVVVSNGLDWSPDGRTFYFIDTRQRRVDRFDYDVDTGAIRDRQPLVAFERDELPDGMSVDADGRLWVAMFGAGEVRCFDPDGAARQRVALPTPNVTSCAFGGAGLDQLYVTSATSRDGSHPEPAWDPPAGAVFRVDGLATGRPANRYAG